MKFDNCIYDHLQLADRFLTMAGHFLRLHKDGYENKPCNLDMGASYYGKISCGTVACHAGWAGVILSDCVDLSYIENACKLSKYFGFHEQDFSLGVPSYYIYFASWAGKHKEIWGNDYGVDMFWLPAAFYGEYPKDINLFDIAKHYIGVAERLMKLEDK